MQCFGEVNEDFLFIISSNFLRNKKKKLFQTHVTDFYGGANSSWENLFLCNLKTRR